ncbi:hypothetical protein KM043_009223 [Ampulex compressa]|nr:hypothetical protein KM043_009223 [Ampulex compressa]
MSLRVEVYRYSTKSRPGGIFTPGRERDESIDDVDARSPGGCYQILRFTTDATLRLAKSLDKPFQIRAFDLTNESFGPSDFVSPDRHFDAAEGILKSSRNTPSMGEASKGQDR